MSAAERASKASRAEQANGRASGPVLQSRFLVILAHSASGKRNDKRPKGYGRGVDVTGSRTDGRLL